MSTIPHSFPQQMPSLPGGQPTAVTRLVQATGLLVAALLVGLALMVG